MAQGEVTSSIALDRGRLCHETLPFSNPLMEGKNDRGGDSAPPGMSGGWGSPQRPGHCSVLAVELGGGSQIGPGPCHIHMCSLLVYTCPHMSTRIHMGTHVSVCA